MKYKMHTCHVTSFHHHHHHHHHLRRLSPPHQTPPARITNPSSVPRPWSHTIRITTATSPCAHPTRLENSHGLDEADTEIEQIGKNSRRIRSKIAIDASLATVWSILTDYERLAEFIPGLAVSQLVEKTDTYARLFQIGQQNLAFGIKFNAKGIVDCYEKDLETLPFGQRRDIEFRMIEGDFQLFEGKWSIEQYNVGGYEADDSLIAKDIHSTLSYVVDVEPKLWLPVGLVEGRLCREIKLNLSCIREEAQRRS